MFIMLNIQIIMENTVYNGKYTDLCAVLHDLNSDKESSQ